MAKAGQGETKAASGVSGRKRRPLRVLVIRHAIAEEASEFARTGAADAERPLTRAGKRRMREAARGLATLIPNVSILASSPLVRAVQTAEIVARGFAKSSGQEPEMTRLSALAPGKPANVLLSWLAEQSRDGVVAVVGHEPHLGQFISWTLTGLRESFVGMKKGQAVMLEFADEVRPGKATLLWSLRPGQLRSMQNAE